MKTSLKIIFGLAVFLFLAAAAAIVFIHFKYPPEKMQAIALEKLQAASHREIRLSGVQLGLRGLSLQGLDVSEEPDFKAGTFLRAGTLRVQPRLLALLRGRIELASVLVSNWDCNIIHRANGTWNFETTSAERGKGKANPSPRPSPQKQKEDTHNAPSGAEELETAWYLDRVELENGAVHYQDQVAREGYTLKKIQIWTKRFRPEGKFPFGLSADYSGPKMEGRLELSGTADLGGLAPAKMFVGWDPLRLQYDGLTVESRGEVKNLAAPEVSFKFSLPKQRIDPAFAKQWPPFLPAITPVQLEGDVRKSGNSVDISNAKIIWNSLSADLSGEAQLKDKGSPDIHLKIVGDFSLSDMAKFFPANAPVKPKGNGSIRLRADGPANLPALTGEASLHDGAFSYDGQSFSALEILAKFTPALITAQTHGNWNKSNFQINANARNYRVLPEIAINGQLAELDLGSFSQLFSAPEKAGPSGPQAPGAPPPSSKENAAAPRPGTAGRPAPSLAPVRTAGQFTIGKITHPNFNAGATAITWDLQNANIPSRITGSAKFEVGPGRFDDLQGLVAGKPLIKALLAPIVVLQRATSAAHIPLLPSFGRVNFKSITGDYVFENGVMTIRKSHLDSSDADVTATGKADLGKETLNMHVATKLLVHGINGPIGFHVGGTFSNPSVKLDPTSILKQPVVNQAIQQGTKLLHNLFK